MQFRSHRGYTISEIGVGCYGLSGAYGKKDPGTYRRMLEQAIHSGVTFFDTADTYGDLAEELLGEVVRPHRASIFLATKVGMRGSKQPDLSHAAVVQACEASLRRLQTEYIDLYQVHFDDPNTPVEETLGALDELAQAGKIRAFGVGHLPVERIRAYLASGKIFSGQFELSAVARDTRKEVLPLLQSHGAGLLAFSVTGRGLLSGQHTARPAFEPGDIRTIDPLFQRERYRSALQIAEKFSRLGQLYGKSCVQTAIAWVLAQPGVLCALTGPSSPVHLAENLGGSGWQISAEHLAELESFFDREDARLHAEQVRSLRDILGNAPAGDPAAAILDLIYAIETAITCGWVAQESVMPLFMDVLRERKAGAGASQARLEKIRQELAEIVLPAMDGQAK